MSSWTICSSPKRHSKASKTRASPLRRRQHRRRQLRRQRRRRQKRHQRRKRLLKVSRFRATFPSRPDLAQWTCRGTTSTPRRQPADSLLTVAAKATPTISSPKQLARLGALIKQVLQLPLRTSAPCRSVKALAMDSLKSKKELHLKISTLIFLKKMCQPRPLFCLF